MSQVEEVIDLLGDAARPREAFPPGELDRRRSRQVAAWERLQTAGMIEADDLQAMIQGYDRHLGYQRDHPLNEIDDQLDAAMTAAQRLDAGELHFVADLTDAPVRERLNTYAVRCAARALAQGSAALCERGLLALLLTMDSDERRGDGRDLMVSLAPLHVAAQKIGPDPAVLFGRYAGLAPPHAGKVIRDFGARADVTLEAFGWALAPGQSVSWIVLKD